MDRDRVGGGRHGEQQIQRQGRSGEDMVNSRYRDRVGVGKTW